MSKPKKLILKMVYIALFTALIFVATYVQINFSIGGMIHLGNFVAILVSLLFGGYIGGISASLGMGFYDVLNGYPYTTFVRTFIVKFCFCFIIGVLFRRLLKKEKEPNYLPLILTVLFFAVGSVSLYCYIFKPELIKEPLLFLLSAILMYIFMVFYLILMILRKKMPRMIKGVIISSSIGILINIIFEFILRVFFLFVLGSTFDAAILESTLKMPSAIFNGFITLIMIFITYMPLYLATKNINKLNDLPKE